MHPYISVKTLVTQRYLHFQETQLWSAADREWKIPMCHQCMGPSQLLERSCLGFNRITRLKQRMKKSKPSSFPAYSGGKCPADESDQSTIELSWNWTGDIAKPPRFPVGPYTISPSMSPCPQHRSLNLEADQRCSLSPSVGYWHVWLGSLFSPKIVSSQEGAIWHGNIAPSKRPATKLHISFSTLSKSCIVIVPMGLDVK